MDKRELNELRKKMIACYNTQFSSDHVRCPTIKQMAKYLKDKQPKLKVELRKTSQYKTTKPSGFRYTTGGGTKEYSGTEMRIYKNDIKIFEHDTTETYRTNSEVAQFIIENIEKDSMYNYDDKGDRKK